MPELSARLRRLRRLPRRQRVATLRSVLPWAVGDELDAFAAEAIDLAQKAKGRFGLLIEVFRAWARLSPEARDAALVVAGEALPELIAGLSGSGAHADRRVAAEIASVCVLQEAQCTTDVRAGFMLVLHRLSSDHGAAAHAALTGLADAFGVIGHEHPELGTLLDAAVADAASRYHEHRHDGLLQAIADGAHTCGPRVSAWLDERSDAGHMAMRSLVRRNDPGSAIERAVTDLGVASLAPAAIAALESIDEPQQRITPLSRSHLLGSRGRTATLGRLRNVSALLGEAWDGALPVSARLGAVRWLERVPLKPAERVRRLAEVLQDPDAGVRLRTCMALRSCPASPQADAALRDFAFDVDERVAHHALSTLVTAPSKRRREAQRDVLERLEHSEHVRVARLASGALEMMRSRDLEEDELHAALAGGDRSTVLRAIERVERGDLGGSFVDTLIDLTEADDPYVAAKSVLALTRTPGERVRRVLLGALGHTDERVVADAVEALGRREGASIAMDAFATSSVARVRANALHHALRTDPSSRPAQHALAEMLMDPRASHRLSALWVTERTGQTSLAERVAQIIRDDEERAVRVRAERCATRLLAQMRRGWTDSTSTMAAG